ncbi:MAG: hypothetical protein JXB62_22670 [Pirellulales bacterium]|nr:hypothetical protein [Pirellulales bacterium]
MSRPRWTDLCLAAGVLLWLVGCLGCGTAEYEDRVEARIREARQGSAFAQMQSPVTLPGTSLKVQVPNNLESTPLPDDTPADRLNPLASEQSSFVTGRKLTYEGLVEDSEQGKLPFYCYLIVLDPESFRGREPVKNLWQSLKNDFAGEASPPAQVKCQTPQGLEIEWQMVRVTAPQKFVYVKPDGQSEPREMPGIFEFYVRTEGDHVIVIAWRVPEHLESHVGLKERAHLVAGSVTSPAA